MDRGFKTAQHRIEVAKRNKSIKLDLSGLSLKKIPNEITNLTNLESLSLQINRLSSFPKNFSKLTKLTHLNLASNNLEELPKNFSNFINLRWLNIAFNHFVDFPLCIPKLHNLNKLILIGCKIKSIPESISGLQKLTTFHLQHNNVKHLPEAFGKLKNITELHLYNNQFQVGKELFELPVKEQISELLKWQKAQEEGTLKPIHEAKVIFIGESNYGKTHLIELLKEGEIKREIKTTHGIERSYLNIPFNDKDIRLNIWDLGGQEFMRSTHQFFFSERTLYVLVTLARRERKELNHWLRLANQLGNKAPVLVVINKIDLDPHDIDRRSLQRDYPNIIGFVRTCINDCESGDSAKTINELVDKITKIVTNKTIMPGVFEQRPPDWFVVKDELEKLEASGIDYISFKEYENLDFIKNLPPEDQKSNLKLLSVIGTVVSFVDDPRLIDTNVINPQWIMDGVYSIINDPIVKDETKGRLHINDLERILPKERFPKERHVFLLELMRKFNLCYAAKDKRDIFFIPDLFEDVEPDFTWKNDTAMHFRYNYDDFSPNTFLTRFIVEMHQDIVDNKRWRSGVYITNGSCFAKVYQSFRKNYINIEVIGTKEECRSYLYSIREAFRKLHHPFSEMRIKQELKYKSFWLDYLILTNRERKNKPIYHDELDIDLPIVNILNGYTTSADRQGSLKVIKIFLASSSELKTDRKEFEVFINNENQRLYQNGIFLKLELWEDFIDSMSKTRLQDEYNFAIEKSDIFVSLFHSKVGIHTEEEFEVAFGKFKKTGKPLVYTYFKNAPIKPEEINDEIKSLLAFREKLKMLGHYRTVYKTPTALKTKFRAQLDKILDNI